MKEERISIADVPYDEIDIGDMVEDKFDSNYKGTVVGLWGGVEIEIEWINVIHPEFSLRRAYLHKDLSAAYMVSGNAVRSLKMEVLPGRIFFS